MNVKNKDKLECCAMDKICVTKQCVAWVWEDDYNDDGDDDTPNIKNSKKEGHCAMIEY